MQNTNFTIVSSLQYKGSDTKYQFQDIFGLMRAVASSPGSYWSSLSILAGNTKVLWTVKYTNVQCSAGQCSAAIQCSVVQCSYLLGQVSSVHPIYRVDGIPLPHLCSVVSSVVQCSTLHYTALYCTALHCTALKYLVKCSAVYCTAE